MRTLWVLFMIAGVVVLGGAAVLGFAGIPIGSQVVSLRPHIALFLLLAAGACAAGIFMKPREFQAAIRPEHEEEVVTADWIKEMRREQDSTNKPAG